MFGSSKKVSLKLKEGQKAFSLIELLVSLTIMTIVTMVVLARHQSFNGAVLLRNQAYDVAFTIRQAQLLAVSASTGGSSVNQTYGVNIDVVNNTYQVFYDGNNNGRFDAATDTQVGPRKKLDQRFAFRRPNTSGAAVNTSMDITFARPNFDAIVRADGSNTVRNGPHYLNIAIAGALAGDNSPTVAKRVEILNSGNISVVNY